MADIESEQRFELFNDILDIATKTRQEDEDDDFFGEKTEKNEHEENKKLVSDEKKKEHPTVQFAPSPIVRGASVKDNYDDNFTNENATNINKETESDVSSEYQNEKSGDSNNSNEKFENSDLPTRHDSQSSVDEEIKEASENLIAGNEAEENFNKSEKSDESDVDESESESIDKHAENKDGEMTSYRESSDSISNIDLESFRPAERKEIKTVSFSMQYDKFCNVLNRIETGMTGGSVSFDVDAVTDDNKLIVSPTTEYQPNLQPLAEQPPMPLSKRKKRRVKKKRKKSANTSIDSTERSKDEPKCHCKTCKCSIYNQSQSSSLNHMFKSNSQPPTPPTPMIKKTVRPKTTGALKNSSKMIDLDFSKSHQRTSSKLDADLKKSGNPVLIAWLKVKNEEEKQRKKKERKEEKRQQQMAQEKLLKMRQRSFAATERVQEWINRKRVQSVESRKEISPPESYKSVPSEPFDYSDEKFESGISSDEENTRKAKGVTLPQIFPTNRPKTSRGPQNRLQKVQKTGLISISPSGKNFKERNRHLRLSSKEEATFTQTDDSGLANDELGSESSKESPPVKKESPATEESSSGSESEQREDDNQATDDGKDNCQSDSEQDMTDEEDSVKIEEQENDGSANSANEKEKGENSVDSAEEKKAEEQDDENDKVHSESEVKMSESEGEIEHNVHYILNILNTQIKFDSVRDFTDLIIHDAVEEIEINSRLKQKRLRRPLTSSTASSQFVPSPPKSKVKIESANSKKESRDNSFNSVKDLVNFEKTLLNGNQINTKHETSANVKKNQDSPHDEWLTNKNKEAKKKKEREKALNDFYHELEMKIVQDEKVRRVMEKEASKKRVDTGLHHKKYRNTSETNNSNFFKPIQNGDLSPKYNGLSQQENLLKFGRVSEKN